MGTGAEADRARAVAADTDGELRRLAKHRRWDVRRAVALNPQCPFDVLRRLVIDKVWAVRAGMAAAAHTPEILLLRLASADEVPPVRLALAGNPAATPQVVAALVDDADRYVRGKALGHPAAPPEKLAKYARGTKTPAWVLRRIANNPACPEASAEEILTWLALGGADGDPTFDPDACASHPGDPDVAEWAWYRIQATAAKHPHLHPLWRVRQQVTLTRSPIPHVMRRVLARDPRDEVRLTLTGFPGMHHRILRELADDANETIAERAAATLKRKPAFDRQRYGRLRLKSPSVRRWAVAAVLVSWTLSLAFGDHGAKSDKSSQSALDAVDNFFHPSSTLATGSYITYPVATQRLPGGGEVRSGEMAVEIAAGTEALKVTSVTGAMDDSVEFDWLDTAPFVIEPGSILRFTTGPLQPTSVAVTCRVGEEPNERFVLSLEGDSL
jgi:hypothetical protein